MYYPAYVFVFNAVISFIDDRLYFTFASWLLLIGLWNYCHVLADAFESREHLSCHSKTHRALPDADFVASYSYTCVVALGFHRDRVRFSSWITWALAWSAPLLYAGATLYTEYFTLLELCANTGVAVLAAGLFYGVACLF